MAFDSGTWWLVGLTSSALIGAVTYLVKLTVFTRVDKCESKIEQCVAKADFDKVVDKLHKDIELIREDFLMKEDFYREIGKMDRKLDTIMDILLKRGDSK